MLTLGEQSDKFKKDCLEDKHPKLKELYKKLVSDLSKDPSSKETQQIVEKISDATKKVMNFTKETREVIIGVIPQSFIYQIPSG